MKKIGILILLVVLALFSLTGCVNGKDEYFMFGVTTFDSFYGGNSNKAKVKMENLIKEAEDVLSPTKKGSDVYKINEALANEEVEVSALTFDILKFAKEKYEETFGAFNIALYNATILWGFDANNEDNYSVSRPEPSSVELDKIREFCNLDDLILLENGKSVYKTKDNLKIDLGGVAKGYLADKCFEIARQEKLKGGILNLGGNIYLLGEKNTDSGNYTIGITNPRLAECENKGLFAKISVKNTSIVTSGDYNRYYIFENKRYHHIIDGATLKPTDNGICAVTIINSSSALCDVYSTAVFVMGTKKGVEFLNSKGIDAIIITSDFKYILTGNVKDYITDIHKEFKPYE